MTRSEKGKKRHRHLFLRAFRRVFRKEILVHLSPDFTNFSVTFRDRCTIDATRTRQQAQNVRTQIRHVDLDGIAVQRDVLQILQRRQFLYLVHIAHNVLMEVEELQRRELTDHLQREQTVPCVLLQRTDHLRQESR